MTDEQVTKPNCYKCKHRGRVPGDAHSCCNHPSVAKHKSPMGEVIAILGSAGRVPPMVTAPQTLNVEGESHGIRNGWFNWPYNFDPVWLNKCNGFEQKGE